MDFEVAGQTVTVNMPTQAALLAEITRRLRAGQGFALATLNMDHLVKLAASPDFARVYAAQDLVVADGRPVVALSRLARRPVDLVPGSDLVLPLARLAAAMAVPVVLVGSTDIALADAERVLCAAAPGLRITLRLAPSAPFDPGGDEAAAILHQIKAQGPCLCFLALGAPKQETLALRGRTLAPQAGFASVGAGLDFLGGHQLRAPVWMRAVALEWLWRMLGDPRRMAPRYARSFAILPGQVWRALRLRRRD
jgi:exopolysaccharide biosynthesis WecB/TagA/CpsF family protein